MVFGSNSTASEFPKDGARHVPTSSSSRCSRPWRRSRSGPSHPRRRGNAAGLEECNYLNFIEEVVQGRRARRRTRTSACSRICSTCGCRATHRGQLAAAMPWVALRRARGEGTANAAGCGRRRFSSLLRGTRARRVSADWSTWKVMARRGDTQRVHDGEGPGARRGNRCSRVDPRKIRQRSISFIISIDLIIDRSGAAGG